MSQPPNTRSSRLGQRHEVLDQRGTPFGAFPETDGSHLRQRPNRTCQLLSNREGSGNRGGADGAQSNEQNTDFPAGRGNRQTRSHGAKLYHSGFGGLPRMAGWFRKGLSRHHTAIAMIGSKAGDQVLVVGASDPGDGRRGRVGHGTQRRDHRVRSGRERARASGSGRTRGRRTRRVRDGARRRHCLPRMSRRTWWC